MEGKNHYRKPFKSDHLSSSDVEQLIEQKISLIFTISKVKYEEGVMVAGNKGNHNIAYFKEDIKPLVLNAENSEIVKRFAGGASFVEDWEENILVELYVNHKVKFGNKTVKGIRIKNRQPVLEKKELVPGCDKWLSAKRAVKEEGATIESIRDHWVITDENFKLLEG